MAAHDLVQGIGQGIYIQLAFKTNGPWNVVQGVVGIDLVEHPQPLLGKGQGQRLIPWHGSDARALRQMGRRDFLRLLGQACDAVEFKEHSQRKLDVKGAAYAGDDLSGQQGVATEIEKVVIYTDLAFVPMQYFRPDLGDGGLRGGMRGDIGSRLGDLFGLW